MIRTSKAQALQRNRRGLLLAGAIALASPLALAQGNWPSKPVTVVVPFPAGGGTDAFARPLAAALTKNLGRQFIIDNKGGAGGTVGASVAARAAPDGYTLFMGAVHHAIAPSMYPKLDYNIETDFVPIGMISSVPQVIVVHPQRVPASDLKGLLEYLRKNPGKLNYASAGNGTAHHLAGELFKLQTNTFITHIPYRGAGPALQDLIAGQVDMMFDGLGSSAAHIKAGRIKRPGGGLRQARARLSRPAGHQRAGAGQATKSPPGTGCGRRRARRRTWSIACRPEAAQGAELRTN